MRLRLAALAILITSLLTAAAPEDEVRAVLDEQIRAWNQGDLAAFAQTYAADTIVAGKELTRGRTAVLQRYQRNYPTPERMGTLKFSDIEVRMLGDGYASVLGRFELQRTQTGGGPAQGVFTLLLKRSGKTWSIILDHTS